MSGERGADAALSPQVIEALAQAQGFPLANAAMAERLAAGASAAIAVVREELAAWSAAAPEESAGNPLFDCEPGDFLLVLERLA
jgi:hypothetical protein